VRELLKLGRYAFAAIGAVALSIGSAHADWSKGQFSADGKPVVEYHCVPEAKPPYPAVILLHGAGPRGVDYGRMERMCGKLAAAGYYTEFIEYYSQTEDIPRARPARIKEFFPVWLREIRAGVETMQDNPRIDSRRIGIMGFSLGSFLSLSIGATDPGSIVAIVEYYGELPDALHPMAHNLPPTLILHGDADKLVPVAEAHELDALMTRAKVAHQIHIYPGANHAFNFQIPLWYNAADAQDAWQRSLTFLAEYLGGRPALKSQAASR
jgi:dienelactone hydrolase